MTLGAQAVFYLLPVLPGSTVLPVPYGDSETDFIKVRGSPQMGYLLLVRDGPGALPDLESCRDAATTVTWNSGRPWPRPFRKIRGVFVRDFNHFLDFLRF